MISAEHDIILRTVALCSNDKAYACRSAASFYCKLSPLTYTESWSCTEESSA